MLLESESTLPHNQSYRPHYITLKFDPVWENDLWVPKP